MALIVDNRQFYCTTADVYFGPYFETDGEGEEFRAWVYRNHGDARQFEHCQLVEWLIEFRRSKRCNLT